MAGVRTMRARMAAAAMAMFVFTAGSHARSSPLCCEDFRSANGSAPDGEVNVSDLLEMLARWGPVDPQFTGADIAPPGPGGCPDAGDGLINVSDLLALLAAWGPCDSPIDECADAMDPLNGPARITAPGIYHFRLNGVIDGPQRGPTNDQSVILDGPTTCGWYNYGVNVIDGQFQYGDGIGIRMIGPVSDWVRGGDIWFHYTALCDGALMLSAALHCSDGQTDRVYIELYAAIECPKDWTTVLECVVSESDDCGTIATINRAVIEGDEILIRIAGELGERGDGALDVRCTPELAPE